MAATFDERAEPRRGPAQGERDADEIPSACLTELQGQDYDAQAQALEPGQGGYAVQRSALAADAPPAPSAAFGAATSGSADEVPYRTEMEQAFGQDFSGVRSYTGQAGAMGQLRAEAAAQGDDVAFADASPSRHLVAHELTHVVQQRQAGGGAVHGSDTTSSPSDPAELEAESVASRVVAGQAVTVSAAPGAGIHLRQRMDTLTEITGDEPAPVLTHRDGMDGLTEITGDEPEPDPNGPTIAATSEAMGKSNTEQMDEVHEANPAKSVEKGVWYAHNYVRAMKRAGKEMPEAWWKGHAPESHFKTYGFMKFRLKVGKSAAEAIEAFFAGPTVCECFSIMVAMQYRTILRAVGKEKFDQAFGAASDAMPSEERMFVEMGMSWSNPLRPYRQRTKAAEEGKEGKMGDRPALPGEWYYVYNHPQYLLKHPRGAYQGENCFCMGTNARGEQIWRGFGVSNVTEEEMLREMAQAYNATRTKRDGDFITSAADPDLFDVAKGHFKERIDWTDILKDPAYTYGGRERKGGFVPAAGVTLNTEAVKKLRG